MRSQRAGRDYDVEGKLPQLREAFDDVPPHGGELLEQGTTSSLGGVGAGLSRLAPTLLKLAVLAAVGGVAVYLAWPEPAGPQVRARPARPVRSEIAARPAERDLTPPPVPQPQPAVTALEPAADDAIAAPGPAPSAEAAPRSSRREIAQLVRIRALLERDPAAAHRLAERGEREFPRGVLSEERQALQVLALAKSGDWDAATQRARQFFARYPQSPMRELVEAALRR